MTVLLVDIEIVHRPDAVDSLEDDRTDPVLAVPDMSAIVVDAGQEEVRAVCADQRVPADAA